MNLEQIKKSWMVRPMVQHRLLCQSAKIMRYMVVAIKATILAKREPVDLRAVDIPHSAIVLEK